jgi:hypothetical protein
VISLRSGSERRATGRKRSLLAALAIVGAALLASPAGAAINDSITSPASGAHSLSGVVTVTANASADAGVQSVQLYVDGSPSGLPVTTTTAQYTYQLSWDTTGAAVGNHTLAVLATDWSTATQMSAPITVDVGPAYPTVSLTSPAPYTFVSGGSVPLTSTTTAAVGNATVAYTVDGSPVTSPWNSKSVADGSHTITATVTDGRGKTATASAQVTVDNTAPTTAVTAPSANAYATGTLAVSTTASDAYGIKSVQYQVGNTLVGSPITSPDSPGGFTYSTTIDLTHFLLNGQYVSLLNGPYTLTEITTDNAGNTATATVPFTIGTAPLTAVAITAPTNYSYASKNATLTAVATGGTAPYTGSLIVDGVTVTGITPVVNGNTLTWTGAITALPDGVYTVAVTATDKTGTKVTSSTINVTVDNTPPSTYLIAPAANAVFTGTMPVQAHASDAYGIKSVQYLVDGKAIGALLTTPDTAGGYTYSTSLSLAGLANGPHTLADVATDNAGNPATSAPVTIYVGVGPPAASITSPTNYAFAGANYSLGSLKTTPIVVAVTGGTGPYTGTLLVDGAATTLAPTVSGGTLTFQWDSTKVTDGTHTLAVTVKDSTGATVTTTVVNVTVDNTLPSGVMYLPTPLAGYTYARTNGPTQFQVHASDAYGVKGVEFLVDGAVVSPSILKPDTGQTYLYSYTYDTSKLAAGLHSIQALVVDNANNSTLTAPIYVKSGAITYVPVINWHGITGPLDTAPDVYDQSPAEASAELAYLKASGYQSITLPQYETWLSTGALPAGITKPVLLTVDDGLTDELAWDPLLQQYGFKAVLFVVTGFADNKTPGSNDPTANMSWAQIKSLAANGRWTIAFHAGEYGHGDYSEAANTIAVGTGQAQSYSTTCFEYYNCLGTITTTTTTGSGTSKKTTVTKAAETPAQFEAQVKAEVTAGMAELKAEVPSADMTAWACPWNACGQWTNFYNDASNTLQGWMPGYFASLFPVVFMQTDPVTYGLASGTVGSLNSFNRHYRFEVLTSTTTAQFAAALTDPAFANN